MKYLRILLQIGLLDGFYYIGLFLQKASHLPVPGSVIGLMLLFAALTFKLVPVAWIEAGSTFIQAYLPLFFIPATVGIIEEYHVFASGGQWILFILIFSTLMTLAASGAASQWLAGRRSVRKEKPACSNSLHQ